MAEEKDHLEALLKAKIRIMSSGNLFFIGPALANLKFVEQDTLPTFATDGRYIYYNKNFLLEVVNDRSGKGIDQLIFIIVHEIFHVIFDHIGRRGSREPFIWNMAIDYITNYILVNNQIGAIPPGCLYDKKFHDGLTPEEVYDMLLQDKDLMEKYNNSRQIDVHIEIDENMGSDTSEIEKDESGNIRIRVSREFYEKNIRNMKEVVSSVAGNAPEGIRRLFERIINPPVIDWKQKLAAFIEDNFRIDYGYKKLHKYSYYTILSNSNRVLLPGILNEDRITVNVYIDASGSITEPILKEFISEVCHIVQNNPARDCILRISSFDTEIYDTQIFDSTSVSTEELVENILSYEVKGGGGTSIRKLWHHMEEFENGNNGINLVIILTDGEIWDWGDPGSINLNIKTLMVIRNDSKRIDQIVKNMPLEEIEVVEWSVSSTSTG